MPKRDPIAEILEKRSRLRKKTRRWILFYEQVKPLHDAIELLGKDSDSAASIALSRYTPVALVAALESYVRTIIKELVNHGRPFKQNAQGLTEIRLDLPTVLRIQGARISMGEFLSHLLPLSSMDDINRHLSTLIGTDFYVGAKKVVFLDDGETLEQTDPKAWAELAEVFRLRHIVCHEGVALPGYTLSRARQHYYTLLGFALATDTYVDQLLARGQKAAAGA